MRLQDKVAIITGASYGIGRAIALSLACEGCNLALVARTKNKLEKTRQKVEEKERIALAIPADISKWADDQMIVKRVINNFRKIDILVNNASGWSSKTLEDVKISEIEELINTTVKGTMLITKAFLPYFKKQRYGNIINIVSLEGWPLLSNTSTRTPFASAKFAIAGFSQILRREVKKYGVKVTAIYPGSTASSLDISHQFDSDYPYFEYKDTKPKGKLLVTDITSAVLLALTCSKNARVEEIVITPNGVG